jgi:hypothetical protein
LQRRAEKFYSIIAQILTVGWKNRTAAVDGNEKRASENFNFSLAPFADEK